VRPGPGAADGEDLASAGTARSFFSATWRRSNGSFVFLRMPRSYSFPNESEAVPVVVSSCVA